MSDRCKVWEARELYEGDKAEFPDKLVLFRNEFRGYVEPLDALSFASTHRFTYDKDGKLACDKGEMRRLIPGSKQSWTQVPNVSIYEWHKRDSADLAIYVAKSTLSLPGIFRGHDADKEYSETVVRMASESIRNATDSFSSSIRDKVKDSGIDAYTDSLGIVCSAENSPAYAKHVATCAAHTVINISHRAADVASYAATAASWAIEAVSCFCCEDIESARFGVVGQINHWIKRRIETRKREAGE